MANAEVFDSFFRRADLDHDGRISGGEAVGFFQGSGLPQATLAKVCSPFFLHYSSGSVHTASLMVRELDEFARAVVENIDVKRTLSHS